MSESSASGRPASACGREHAPLASPMLDDPRPFYARARREEPVFWSDSLGLWVVTRYDDVAAVAKDAARFSSMDSIPPSVGASRARTARRAREGVSAPPEPDDQRSTRAH